MGWLDDWLTDLGTTAPKPTAPAIAKPAKPRQPKPEIKCVWFQTRAPQDSEDVGAVEAGHYWVADGVLSMCDETGKPTGKEYQLGPDDDARQIAGRLAREAWVKARGESDFNRPLSYQPFGIV